MRGAKRMRRIGIGLASALLAVGLLAPSANAAFGVEVFDGAATANPAKDTFTQAGGHPYDVSTVFLMNSTDVEGDEIPDGGGVKELVFDLPPGFAGDPTAVPVCRQIDFASLDFFTGKGGCLPSTQVGVATHAIEGPDQTFAIGSSVFNLEPPTGVAASFGFYVARFPVFVDVMVNPATNALRAKVRNITQYALFYGTKFTLWGVPADSSHDSQRCAQGLAGVIFVGTEDMVCGEPKSLGMPRRPFLVGTTSCSDPGEGLVTKLRAIPWVESSGSDEATFETHEPPGFGFDNQIPPSSWGPTVGIEGCENVPFDPTIESAPTTDQAETSSGLDFELKFPDDGLLNPDGIAQSHLKNAKVILPEGVTINPSAAEGLGVCSSAQFDGAGPTPIPDPSKGCPATSKVGSVAVRTPILKETIPGSVYVAKPFDNPFGSLLAIYVILEEPQRGVFVKLTGELRTNERTGRIEAEFSELPQLPFTSFRFRFREGGRAPLVTPPACGAYETTGVFTPWARPDDPITTTARFQITKGVGAGPCPKAGVPPFDPGFGAGSINNNAGSYTPFDMRLTRHDGEQDMTRFSATLPPGVLGKLAGIARCPDAAIAAAKASSGGREIANPSCPAGSQIGRSLVGAGVGSVLTYVPGKIYLGGPVAGRPLSVIAITPVVAGPFDVGTVVVREALTLNPKTAEVEVDGAVSDPIPHILKGIPAKLRDLRVYVDRGKFIINPTSCDPESVRSTLFGGYADAFSSADDLPVSLTERFQASSCAALSFKPGLKLNLKGGTARGSFPGLKATYRPRAGDANLEGLIVRLPSSAFLEQAHIRTICTRVQFAAGNCPPAAQYGFIKAWTPLLEEPLAGPVWLRSSNHKLPDLVFDLHGLVDVEVVTRIDSQRGGIRATVQEAPDAPLSKVILRMQGAKKGLIVNSRDLCKTPSRANAQFAGHNGKRARANPVMRAECGKPRKGKRRSRPR